MFIHLSCEIQRYKKIPWSSLVRVNLSWTDVDSVISHLYFRNSKRPIHLMWSEEVWEPLFYNFMIYSVTDLIIALPGNISSSTKLTNMTGHMRGKCIEVFIDYLRILFLSTGVEILSWTNFSCAVLCQTLLYSFFFIHEIIRNRWRGGIVILAQLTYSGLALCMKSRKWCGWEIW